MDNAKLLIRPVQENDLNSILGIAAEVGPGFTSLPYDVKVVESRINRSLMTFSMKTYKPDNEMREYFFVMENLETGSIVGTAAIEMFSSQVWPYYNYKVSSLTQLSAAPQRQQDHPVLYWVNDYKSPTELGTLYLQPQFRGQKWSDFLSRTRCLFIAEFPELFSDTIIAEMRAVMDEEGRFPFWEAIGHHFIGLSYREADILRVYSGKQFIIDLMPKFPIYVDLLPKSAQDAIGKTNEEALGALHILQKEGFKFRNYVDIFDGGPVVEASKDELKTIRLSQKLKVSSCKMVIQEGLIAMVSNTDFNFRARKCPIELTDNGEIILEDEIAKSLNVERGDFVRFCPLTVSK